MIHFYLLAINVEKKHDLQKVDNEFFQSFLIIQIMHDLLHWLLCKMLTQLSLINLCFYTWKSKVRIEFFLNIIAFE